MSELEVAEKEKESDKDYMKEIEKLKQKIEVLEREKAELKEVEQPVKQEKTFRFLEGLKYDY